MQEPVCRVSVPGYLAERMEREREEAWMYRSMRAAGQPPGACCVNDARGGFNIRKIR